jgi:16S rRNA processing protein RimM
MPDTTPADSEHASSEDVVAVGRVGKAHGIRGDVFVEPWTDAVDERFAERSVLQTESGTPATLTVAAARDHSGKLVVHFEGVEDRGSAERIRGVVLVYPIAERPAIDDPDEFYDTDLVGLRVLLVGESVSGPVIGPEIGPEIGSVTEVLHSPGGSVLAIAMAIELAGEGGREVLIPFRKELVPDVNVGEGWLSIDPPEGLLEL